VKRWLAVVTLATCRLHYSSCTVVDTLAELNRNWNDLTFSAQTFNVKGNEDRSKDSRLFLCVLGFNGRIAAVNLTDSLQVCDCALKCTYGVPILLVDLKPTIAVMNSKIKVHTICCTVSVTS
jgi:hypothetical protein